MSEWILRLSVGRFVLTQNTCQLIWEKFRFRFYISHFWRRLYLLCCNILYLIIYLSFPFYFADFHKNKLDNCRSTQVFKLTKLKEFSWRPDAFLQCSQFSRSFYILLSLTILISSSNLICLCNCLVLLLFFRGFSKFYENQIFIILMVDPLMLPPLV